MLIAVVAIALVRAVHECAQLVDSEVELGRDVLEVLRDGLLVVGRLRDALQRLVARHLAGQDQAREVRPALVVAELRRQPVAFVEAREARLVVLVRVLLPAEPVHQLLHRLFLVKGT